MLKSTLEDNELTEEHGDLRAHVTNVCPYTAEELTDKILQIGTRLTRSDIVGELEATKQVIAGILAEGSTVHFELFKPTSVFRELP
ncbi:hypothetical protein PilKf_01418 [Pillotina sp. SPG140]|jgi:hypothetical protein